MATPVAPSKAKVAAAKDSSLTDYVAGFIVDTRAGGIPKDVAHLGKRSVLDGIGLALAGAASQTGEIARKYLRALGFAGEGGSTVIGSDMRIPARFAAFANGISIHADDFDDTQLAIAKDRVYGLLTHPTAPALPQRWRLPSASGAAARTLCSPTRSAWKSSARSPRRSCRGTIKRDSTAPRPAARSARPPPRRSCSAPIPHAPGARSPSAPPRRGQ